MLVVPDAFIRTSHKVHTLMPPEKSGRWLLERMQEEIGFESYAGIRLLDFGCGVRFSQAILNEGLPIGHYTGVDVFAPMIDFLRANVDDPRFDYVCVDAQHPLYSPTGAVLTADSTLEVRRDGYDVVSMFSVITHQYPDASAAIFSILRRYVRPQGHLFFTAFLDEAVATFEDRSPERNGGFCFYNASYLEDMVARCGWRLMKRVPAQPPLLGHAFVYRPS